MAEECRKQEDALARLKCAHCQALMDCEALAQAILVELRGRYRVGRLEVELPDVADGELVESIRDGIACFLRNNYHAGGEESAA